MSTMSTLSQKMRKTEAFSPRCISCFSKTVQVQTLRAAKLRWVKNNLLNSRTQIIKLVSLIVCSVAFGWKVKTLLKHLEFRKLFDFRVYLPPKVIDSYMTFTARRTGTNVDVLSVGKGDMLSFAVCRHPKQILKRHDASGVSLKPWLGLTPTQMSEDLKSVEKVEESTAEGPFGGSFNRAFESFLFSAPGMVEKAVLAERAGETGNLRCSKTHV